MRRAFLANSRLILHCFSLLANSYSDFSVSFQKSEVEVIQLLTLFSRGSCFL